MDMTTYVRGILRGQGLLSFSMVIAALLLLAGGLRLDAASESVGDKLSNSAEEAKRSLEEAGRTAVDKLEEIWTRIDERRLKNRTRDEIVAWVIMGLLAGSLLSRASGVKPVAAVGMGLVGALLGGIVAHVFELNFGLGPVLIRYEDLLCSLVGAVALFYIGRAILARKKKDKPS